jgi:hypothetical protein
MCFRFYYLLILIWVSLVLNWYKKFAMDWVFYWVGWKNGEEAGEGD